MKAPKTGGRALESMAAMWRDYLLKVMPKDAPPVQIQETRRAFYAGATAYHYACVMGIGDDSVEVEAGESYLQQIEDELKEFAKDVDEGRA